MAAVIDWVVVALVAAMLLGSLRVWQGEKRLWRKLVFALFGIHLAVITPALAWSVAHGYHFDIPVKLWPVLIFMASSLWVGVIFWWFAPRGSPVEGPRARGCLSTILSAVGCAIIGYVMFCLLVLVIALGVYLSGQLS